MLALILYLSLGYLQDKIEVFNLHVKKNDFFSSRYFWTVFLAPQRCQMAVATATFQKCCSLDVRRKLVAVKVAVSHAVTVRHHLMTYDTPAKKQQAIAGMLATARTPAATGTPAFKQGTPAGEGTTSTAKTPPTAGSVWKS